MASSLASTSQEILKNFGGPENVASMTHCATRLRVQVRDRDRVDVDAIDQTPDVMGVVPQGTNGVQVVLGGGVANYYRQIMTEPGMAEKSEKSGAKPASGKKEYGGVRSKYSWVDYCFEFLSDTFRPVLWALLGASLIITLLVLADTFGIQSFKPAEGQQLPPTFQFLHAMWRSVFYFLPIMVGATAARKLGANEWVGAAIPAAFFTPEYLDMKETAEKIPTAVDGQFTYMHHVFGIPMVIQDYGGQVFPPLFAAVLLYFLEKGLKKIIPGAVQMVFVPFISLLIMIPVTAFVVGPMGIGIGNGIANLLYAVNHFSPFILAILIPLLYPFLVPLGLHWPLNAIMIVNITTLGYDFIQGPMGAWNFACFGVVTGVMIVSWREGNKQMRQVAAGGMFAGLLGGISEPSLYGVLLRFKKSYLRLLPGCFVGGVIMGIFNVKANAFVFTSLLTIPAMSPALGYAIGIAAAFATSLLLVLFLDYRSKEERDEVRARLATEAHAEEAEAEEPVASTDTAAAAGATTATAATATAATATAVKTKPAMEPGAVTELPAPMDGKVVALSEVPDPMFAGGRMGQGIAIEPSGSEVRAPAAGKVIQAKGHAVALRLDSGIELLIHVGIDTVELKGAPFDVHVAKGQHVEGGDLLTTVDLAAIREAGYPTITPVIVTNSKKFGSVDGHPGDAGHSITVTAKDAE